MKSVTIIPTIFLLLIGKPTNAQQNGQGSSMEEVKSAKMVFVSDIKTTHLIFNREITYVDLGSPYFIADSVQTIIKIRHTGDDIGKPISQETNLTVITENGEYHSIPIRYNRDVRQLSYRIKGVGEYIQKTREELLEVQEREAEIQGFADRLLFARPNANLRNSNEDFGINVTGVFYEKDFIALRISIANGSAIDLDIAQILFRLKLRKKISPDYIYQERVIEPIHIIDKISKLKGFNRKTMVMIFDKFTPNKNEDLHIDILEQKGGRSARV
ncbi:MAG: DUF4138 domain-containing protein, partial [Bacteroidota bacterium]